MAKYIDADFAKLIMEDADQQSRNNEHYEFLRYLYGGMSQLMDDLPAADVAPVNQWISVKDRLPEPTTDVLICVLDAYDGEQCAEVGYWYDHGGIVRWVFDECLREVTHWMPLPEMPKMDGGADHA